MKPIQAPPTNFHATPEEVAATLGARQGWQEEAGVIYDEHDQRLVASITDLARVIRSLGWMVPDDAHATGLQWSAFPEEESDYPACVRAEAQRLNCA